MLIIHIFDLRLIYLAEKYYKKRSFCAHYSCFLSMRQPKFVQKWLDFLHLKALSCFCCFISTIYWHHGIRNSESLKIVLNDYCCKSEILPHMSKLEIEPKKKCLKISRETQGKHFRSFSCHSLIDIYSMQFHFRGLHVAVAPNLQKMPFSQVI